MSAEQLAANAAMQSFINCYLRETNQGTWAKQESASEGFYLPLKNQHMELFLPVRYQSITHRHLFSFPLYYKAEGAPDWLELDVTLLCSLLLKELALEHNHHQDTEEMMQRILQSYDLTASFLESRSSDESLYSTHQTYIQAEQSLLLGHLLHPTPKSRQGMDRETDRNNYSPEMKGAFQLHYFRAHHSIVKEHSAEELTATTMIKNELLQDSEIEENFKDNYLKADDYSLIPVHPLQAEQLLYNPETADMMQNGKLAYLGAQGKAYSATSSIRTLYHEDSPYMFKFSIPVKVTNSLRVNQLKELERGVEVDNILHSRVGEELASYFPHFQVIRDPAYITLHGKTETGFETIIRQNPFQGEKAKEVSLAAGLFQDPFEKDSSMLTEIIRELSNNENRSTEEISKDWFRKYLSISLQPMAWLYFTHGIALEAHQQNSVLKMKDGYPETFYYRDNQGYYFCESKADHLRSFLPDLNKKSDTICSDAIADERFRYYFFINHLFGLINGFGSTGLIEEEELIDVLRSELDDLRHLHPDSPLLYSLLHEETIPSKANLLTRFYDMDELTGSLATQSVYVNITNPLNARERVVHGS
ncbi:IucA/IucC family protein [Alteribacillus sp. HJP-4]|uniref:IucA/IucC family protein n=1 Tax=Alteribacillus sp. HJP-4 TaxID=2775394 RepID=UPI0035CCCAD7